jgi:outer membrane lipase/esterase
MRKTKFALALLTAGRPAACGGNGPAAATRRLKTKFSSQVSFGDSLSDVGSYNVGTVAALVAASSPSTATTPPSTPELTGKNWTELLAAQLGLAGTMRRRDRPAGDATKGFSVPQVAHIRLLQLRPGRLARDQPGRPEQQG